jgi:hypothetical protein
LRQRAFEAAIQIDQAATKRMPAAREIAKVSRAEQ